MKPKVFVTARIPDEGLELLQKDCDVTVNEKDGTLTKQELIGGIGCGDAVLSMLSDAITEDVLNACTNLRVIANYAVGYNNIDIKAATKRGIIVTNTPGVLTEATADLAWALLMDVARRVTEGDRMTRAGKFTGWAPKLLLGYDVYGATLGIIGFGRIGKAMARRAKGFNMRVLYHQRNRSSQEIEKQCNANYATLEELLKTSDFISLHCPLTPETKYLIGEKQLAMMKPSAVLINTARGPVVNESALVRALKEKRIFGAAFDVYENEPKLSEGLTELENVVLAPHIGSASLATRAKMSLMAAQSILDVLSGKTPENVVNIDALRR